MHVTFLIYSLNRGGAERATVNLANHFNALGWEVSILTIRNDAEPAYAIADGVTVHPIGLHASASSPISGLFNNIKRIRAVRGFIKQNKVEALLGMSSSANVLVGLCCLGSRTVAVGSERSHPENKVITPIWSVSRKYGYSLLDLLICLTNETNAWLNNATNAKNIVTIPNGVELPLAMSSPTVPFSFRSCDRQYLVSVGRLIDTKCIDQAIRVFSNLAEKHAQWDLIILGDGPEKDSLNELVAELGLSNRVHLVGGVGNLHDWYTHSDLFVSTSIHEGFPNGLLEAMAYGLPAVAYDCQTGPRDLIINGENGFLVPNHDIQQLEHRLDDLMSSETQRQQFAVRAKECGTTFSMASVANRWAEQLQQTVNGVR